MSCLVLCGWSASRGVAAPYVPASTSMSDASNFEQDDDYEDQQLDDTPPSKSDQKLFAEFDA